MKKITLQDIADMLGVSKGTVDRAVHDRPDVSPETRKKVLDLIEKHNYKPDRIARFLSMKPKTRKIGVLCPTNPMFFWDNVKAGVKAAEDELSDFGMHIVYVNIADDRDPNDISAKMDELLADGVDAVILVPVESGIVKEKIDEAVKGNIAVATLNDDVTDSGRCFYVGPQIRQSGRIAGELAARFLKGRGNAVTINIGLESFEYRERLKGFIEFLSENYDMVKVIANYTFNREMISGEGGNIIKNILENSGDIDAIYVIDGSSLYDFSRIIKSMDRSGDTILIGHEISDDVRRLIIDGTIQACISQDPFSQGYYAVKYMFDYLVDGRKPVHEHMFTRLDIILKENIDYEGNIINPFYNAGCR